MMKKIVIAQDDTSTGETNPKSIRRLVSEIFGSKIKFLKWSKILIFCCGYFRKMVKIFEKLGLKIRKKFQVIDLDERN